MKKVLICGLIAASLTAPAAYAGTAGPVSFDVKASVTPSCVANNGTTTPTIDFGTIAAFDTTAIANKTASIAFKCSLNLAPSASLSVTSGSVAGLTYGLAVDAGTKTAGTGATGDAWVFKVTGSMAAGQAGDSTAPTTDTQTLTVSF